MDTKPTAKNILVAILPAILTVFIIFVLIMPKVRENREAESITNFEECVAAGNPVMESYPRQCRAGDDMFTENIGNELDKIGLIRIDYPRPNQPVSSPLKISGEARGNWYFEATFPVILVDWDGRIIAEHYATAQGEWMTTDFVPFTSTLEFESPYRTGNPEFMRKGTLILKKDNPSDLSENDDALEIPVLFE